MRTVESEEGTIVYFAGIDKARFKRRVVPGDQLLLKLVVGSAKKRIWRFDAEAWVGDELAWILIDLDASCNLGALAGQKVTSNAFYPPEMARRELDKLDASCLR